MSASLSASEALPVAPGLISDEAPFASLERLYKALSNEDRPGPDFSDRIVPGRGPQSASLFLLGEQPGDQEDQTGQTFVGPAGKMLQHCLLDAAIDPAATFQTNAVKRFKFLPRGKKRVHQTPNAGDIAHYRWWVGQEIRLVDPTIVVTLGLTALQALIGVRRPLKTMRGRLWRWNGRMLLATAHPSYLLRLRPGEDYARERPRFVTELHLAAEAVT